ncbi:MAG: LrgB family protein, partial [Lachnospiraceae bacterium]|nr:LrgB family protein [Lachnospiraceae bacterium]
FNLDKTVYATMAPKSITTAIGMVLSEETGGVVNITVAMIVITGNTGYLLAETIIKIFKIKSPVAKGIAIGSSAHVLGTSKAVELGDVEGAMSGLAVAVAGIVTVIVVPILLG